MEEVLVRHIYEYKAVLVLLSGAVEVFYQARSGNISLSQGETVSAATPGVDFNGTVMSVVIEDQISSVTFLTDIINVCSHFV